MTKPLRTGVLYAVLVAGALIMVFRSCGRS